MEPAVPHFYDDEETVQRRARLSKTLTQFNMLGATNAALERVDPNVRSRFIVWAVDPELESKTVILGLFE